MIKTLVCILIIIGISLDVLGIMAVVDVMLGEIKK